MRLVEKHGKWALFWGALAPIPYKFVSISAGVLNIDMKTFVIITIIGRLKRYLIEGMLVYYFGGAVIELGKKIFAHSPLLILSGILLAGASYLLIKWANALPNQSQ